MHTARVRPARPAAVFGDREAWPCSAAARLRASAPRSQTGVHTALLPAGGVLVGTGCGLASDLGRVSAGSRPGATVSLTLSLGRPCTARVAERGAVVTAVVRAARPPAGLTARSPAREGGTLAEEARPPGCVSRACHCLRSCPPDTGATAPRPDSGARPAEPSAQGLLGQHPSLSGLEAQAGSSAPWTVNAAWRGTPVPEAEPVPEADTCPPGCGCP